MRLFVEEGLSIEYIEGKCSNSKCSNEVNYAVMDKGRRYCVQCQGRMLHLKKIFPSANTVEIRKMLIGEDFTQVEAVAFFGIPRGTLKGYRQRGYVTIRRGKKDSLISAEELIRFKEELEDFVLLKDASKELKIPYPYFRRMIYTKRVRSYRFLDRKAVRRRDFPMIKGIYSKLRRTVNSRKGFHATSTGKNISVADAVKALGLLDEGMIYARIKDGTLRSRKRKNRWYINKEDFVQLCWDIVNGTVKAINHTQKHARAYLESIAVS